MFLINIILIFIFYCFGISKCVNLTFDNQFPIYENEEYPIKIFTNTKNLPLYTILIVECSNRKEKVVEKVVINPGYLRGLPRMIHGDYFSLLRYNITKDFIKIVFNFKKTSNGANLRFIYFETNSKVARNELLTDIKIQSLWTIKVLRISLHFHWKLELIQRTLDHREGGFIPGSVGILICRATEGSPFNPVSLIGTKYLQKIITEVNIPNEQINEIRYTFLPKIKDHLKKIGCKAGQDVISKTITIFHHPTKICIMPPITGYVINGTTLLCKASDGFPHPKSKWIFINGPKNSQLYFSIDGLGEKLYIKKNAPLGTKWTFNCQVTNHIPNSLDDGIIKSFSFKIGGEPFSLLFKTALVISSIMLACFIILGIVLCRSKPCSKSKNNYPIRGKGNRIFHYSQETFPCENKNEFLKILNASTKNSNERSLNSDCLKLRNNNPVDLV